MIDLAPFPDIEDAIEALIDDLGANGTVIPADLKAQLPFNRIYRFAGADDRITDRAVIGIDTFAATRAASSVRAEQVRQRIIATPHAITVDDQVIVIDTATTTEGPHEVPWGDSDVRRYVASYTVTFRR